MQQPTQLRDIVLVGGGHAHALVIKMWGMQPLPGVRLTLVSDTLLTPYSGMLPGLVAGHYTLEQSHIDLHRLCRWSGVRFIQGRVEQLDLAAKRILVVGRPALGYDLVSINTGCTPKLDNIPGARGNVTPVKPVSQFYQHWQSLKLQLQDAEQPLDIGVVGAGAGGFELIAAIEHAISRDFANLPHRCHWIVASEVLKGHNDKVQQAAIDHCQTKNIQLHREFQVAQVAEQQLHASDGRSLQLDSILWCTAASAANWPKLAGLDCDENGFISTLETLQSSSHPEVFAAGDCAHQIDHPRPKAGVFAVRQGKVLFDNLRRAILQKKLHKHRPQQLFLSLLATGGKQAIASKGNWYSQGRLLWHWKNHIDTKFMAMFNQLPNKPQMKPKPIPKALAKQQPEMDLTGEVMRCGGCGAKVGSDVLTLALKQLLASNPVVKRDDVLVGLEAPDDCAVIAPKGPIAQSVDQFKAMIDDPYLLGKIATNHALSDLYAMAAEPQSAMALVAMPHASEALQQRELEQIMSGILEQLAESGCQLTGGHTSEASELSVGLAVNGLLPQGEALTKGGLKPGQTLVLTKPLGTGVILAADMQAKAQGLDVQNCIDSMLVSNAQAAAILSRHGASAMTDITGFGLAGHLVEMLRASGVGCQLNCEQLPLLPGALKLAEQGISSTLLPHNLRLKRAIYPLEPWQQKALFSLLFDPQTSGGLLAGVATENLEACLADLRQHYPTACAIGQVQLAMQADQLIELRKV